MLIDDRLSLLIDPGSSLEIAAAARSQQPSVASETPGDGVRTLMARIRGRDVAIIAEDSEVLGRTDGEVARAKRYRILDLARTLGLPVILLLDGPFESPPRFDPNAGELAGHRADPRADVDLALRSAPLISVVCGRIVGWARPVLGESDVVIATSEAVHDLAPNSKAVLDIVTQGVSSAMEAVGSVLERLVGVRAAENAFGAGDQSDGWADGSMSSKELAEHFCDEGSYLSFDHVGSGVSTGLGSINGWPVVVVAVGGSDPAVLSSRDLLRLVRSYRIGRQNNLPLLILENCDGLEAEATMSFQSLAELATELRELKALKICVVTGAGHTLGMFPLGSPQLGFDYFIAWPWASLSIIDPPTDYTRSALAAVRESDPWLAAGRGFVDDVLAPNESVESVRSLMSMYMSNRSTGRQSFPSNVS